MLILVVDDVEVLNTMLCNFIITLGHTCDSVFTGQQALSYIDLNTPDLVFLDKLLPDMHGQVVREECEKRNIPVVIISGTEPSLLDSGTFYLQKPFDLFTLQQVITQFQPKER